MYGHSLVLRMIALWSRLSCHYVMNNYYDTNIRYKYFDTNKIIEIFGNLKPLSPNVQII